MRIRPARPSDALAVYEAWDHAQPAAVIAELVARPTRTEAPGFDAALGYEDVGGRSARFIRPLRATPPAGAP